MFFILKKRFCLIFFIVSLFLLFVPGITIAACNSCGERSVSSANRSSCRQPSGRVKSRRKVQLRRAMGDTYTLGSATAPVKVVEYFAFGCAHCRRFHARVFPKIYRQYIKSDTVFWVGKYFPLRVTRTSLELANAARCAAAQNKYWDWLEVTMRRYLALHKRNPENLDRKLISTGIRLNFPVKRKFIDCVRSDTYIRGLFRKKVSSASRRPVNSTPTFFIDGTRYEGYKNFKNFKKLINRALSQ